MPNLLQGLVSLSGRLFIVVIFLSSALANKIPEFNKVAGYMESKGVPAAKIMLAGAIAFLIVGGVSILIGYKARVGAVLLLVFLALATYYFHNFWTIEDPTKKMTETINFMKNLSLMGTMLFIIANGAGAMSLDACFGCKKNEAAA